MSLKDIRRYKYLKDNKPWILSLNHAKARCTNPKHQDYKWYGAKGIKFDLTYQQGEILWRQAHAKKMKCATIDRKNKHGNYTFENCEFIERSVNCGKDKKIPILQYDLKGNFIKEWASATEASLAIGHNKSHVCKVLQNLYGCKTAGGFIWRYKNVN